MLRPYLEKKRIRLKTPISIILATKVVTEKPQMLSGFLEHPFPELSEEYPMLS